MIHHGSGVARLADRLPDNAEGEVFVDSSCIDCATCRMLAPDTFAYSEARGQTIVRAQPGESHTRRRAALALVACPTSSIGTVSKDALDVRSAAIAFPEPVAGRDDVFYCGYAAESSFGARAWLVQRPAGNVLVDSPRAAKPLLDRIHALGGVAQLFLTHRDDVADHAQLRARFGCERILHAADVSSDTRDVERRLDGVEPIRLGPDLLAIPVPGHTRGSTALLYDEAVLFTGDHLWATADRRDLVASRSVCWHSWPEQIHSVERLLDHRFEQILPGHGHPFRAASPAAMREALEKLLKRLR